MKTLNEHTEILLGTEQPEGKKPVTLEVLNFLKTRLLITANSGGGKSWLMRRIAEELCGLLPVIIIDPEGEFKSLREKFPFVLIGPDGEAPADCRSAKFTMLKMLELRTSAIFDLSELQPHDKHRFVRLISEAAIDAPKELWRATVFIFDEAHVFCMDTKTEILTQSGWKRHDQVEAGTDAIAFDVTNESYSVQKIQRVIHRLHDGEMIHLQSDGLDSFTTPEHRSVIQRTQRAKGRTGKYPFCFCPSGEVPNQVSIPIGGGPDNPEMEISDDYLMIVGWVATDGCFTGGKTKRYLSVTQANHTRKMGVAIADKMQDVLTANGATVYQRPERKNGDKITKPSRDFYLGRNLSKSVLELFGSEIHRIPRKLIEQCSKRQLFILWRAMCEGDGAAQGGSWRVFYPGNNEGLADDFQEISIRLGVSATKLYNATTNQFNVLIAGRKTHYARKPKREHYSGMVWDITIPKGAFIARRNGKVFVTGNCPENGKGQSEAKPAVLGFPTRGRKRNFGCIFATQRLAKLALDARAEMLNRIVGMMIEPDDIAAAAQIMGITDKREFSQIMRTVPEGVFQAFGRAIGKEAVLMKAGEVQTSHGIQTAIYGVKAPPAPSQVKKLLPQLADLPKQAEDEANTVEELKQQLREARQTIASAPKAEPVTKTVEKRILTPGESKRLTELLALAKRIKPQTQKAIGALMEKAADIVASSTNLGDGLDELLRGIEHLTARLTPEGQPATPQASQNAATVRPVNVIDELKKPIPAKQWHGQTPKEHTSEPKNGVLKLSGSIGDILRCIADGGAQGVEDDEIAIMTALKTTSRNVYKRQLAASGYIARDGSRCFITDAGIAALGGSWTPLPKGKDLRDYWLNRLTGGELDIFRHHVEAYPGEVTNEDLMNKTGLKQTSINVYKRKLKARRLLDGNRATANLFN